MQLFINKDVNIDDKETALLAILNGMYSKKYNHLATSISLIGYEMTGNFLKVSDKRERNIISSIKEAIHSLADKEIITIIDQDNDKYIFSDNGLVVDTEKDKFVIVEQSEMQCIFQNANKPFCVFEFFCCLIGTINKTTKEWHMSQDDMVAIWGYGKGTVNNYLEQLENMKLIYVYRHKKRRVDGTYHKLNNSYGRYADKDFIIKASKDYENTVECEDVYEKIDRRAIKLRYNAFCNGAKKYKDNPSAVIALYKECVLYNQSLKSNPVEGMYDGEWGKGEPLDLSVFPDYAINSVSLEKTTDQWGEIDHMDKDYSIDAIFDMPAMSKNQTKVIAIKKPAQKENVVPDDAIIQRYADNLYKEQGNECEKSLFILELAEKFPKIDDYEKYWDRAKSFFELNVL